MSEIHNCQQLHEFNEMEIGETKIIKTRFGSQHLWVLETSNDYPVHTHRIFIDYCPFCGAKLKATI